MSLIDSFEDHGFGERPQTGEIIAPGGKDVLPRLDQVALADAIRRLPEEELALALRSKLLPLISIPGLKLFAACGEAAPSAAQGQRRAEARRKDRPGRAAREDGQGGQEEEEGRE